MYKGNTSSLDNYIFVQSCVFILIMIVFQILSRLKTPEWVSLYGMVDIKPGLEILVKCLSRDDPVDVFKFYESLPEIDGIIIPDISAPPLAQG